MRILYAASEVAGFAKTGGLADVAGRHTGRSGKFGLARARPVRMPIGLLGLGADGAGVLGVARGEVQIVN